MIEIIGDIAPRPIMLVGCGSPRPYFGDESRPMIFVAEYAGPNAEVTIIPEAYHCDGPSRRPEEYAQRMVDFFDRAFCDK